MAKESQKYKRHKNTNHLSAFVPLRYNIPDNYQFNILKKSYSSGFGMNFLAAR